MENIETAMATTTANEGINKTNTFAVELTAFGGGLNAAYAKVPSMMAPTKRHIPQVRHEVNVQARQSRYRGRTVSVTRPAAAEEDEVGGWLGASDAGRLSAWAA